jgi:hypothetical protein
MFFHKSAVEPGVTDDDLLDAARDRRECCFTTVPNDRYPGRDRVQWLWLTD